MSEDGKNATRRKVLAASVCALGGVGVGAVGAVLIGSLRPPPAELARTLAAQRRIVDVSQLKPGEFVKVEVGGSQAPVMILRRSEDQLSALQRFEGNLADPTSKESRQPDFARNRFRSMDPEFLVVNLECTHLGCIVNCYPDGHPYVKHLGEDWRGGFICPCHDAKFDLAGRVYEGMPAPLNMVVPPHKFLSGTEILVGHNNDKL